MEQYQKGEFYKDSILLLEGAIQEVTSRINLIRRHRQLKGFCDPIEYVTSRIKSESSIQEKLKRKNLEVTLENALTKIYDAAGIRLICPYIEDIYKIVELIKSEDDIEIVKEKDYIKNPKENGYRSYHLIIKIPLHFPKQKEKVYVEIQIRTIAQDSWASLEHSMKYKKEIKNQKIVVEELKRCADDIASIDINMQSIKNMINGEEDK